MAEVIVTQRDDGIYKITRRDQSEESTCTAQKVYAGDAEFDGEGIFTDDGISIIRPADKSIEQPYEAVHINISNSWLSD